MALPYQITITCTDIADYPEDKIDDPSQYALVRFELSDADATGDEILKGMGLTNDPGELVVRVTQAQKDDFVEGNDYTLDIS